VYDKSLLSEDSDEQDTLHKSETRLSENSEQSADDDLKENNAKQDTSDSNDKKKETKKAFAEDKALKETIPRNKKDTESGNCIHIVCGSCGLCSSHSSWW
jgi:hypothetical protein